MLTVAQFAQRSTMPREDIEELETRYPGFVEARLTVQWSWITARLAKRYAPLGSPAPEIALGWLTDLVTLDCYMRRGWNPASQQDAMVKQAEERARAEVKEAADSETGLFELPLLQSSPASDAVSRGGPLGYAEASPYAWTDAQREAVRS